MQQGNLPQESALQFILGGNALFTVRSLKTDIRFTYKVLRDRHNEGVFRVYFMNGKDNTKDYRMLGNLTPQSPNLQPLSIHTKEIPAFIAFDHFYMNLCIKLYMPSLEIWHEGRCCRCGRVLTVPESIAAGIGPECAFKTSVL